MPRTPTLLVHGGAWAIPDDMLDAHRNGVSNALAIGYALLQDGAAAVDAVEAAVTILEDDETFDAGRGSFLTSAGRVQLDALLMDGSNLRAGGVACVERLRNPIQAARLVLDKSPHVYFVGPGAEDFARQHGMPLIDNAELVLDRERNRLAQAQHDARAGRPDLTFAGPLFADDKSPETAARPTETLNSALTAGNPAPASASSAPASGNPPLTSEGARLQPGHKPERDDVASAAEGKLPQAPRFDSHDTVGAVALDSYGNLAAATSTGGTLNKAPGRVGDSSLIGCGCYADNLSAAVSLTGWGEPIMKLVLGKWAVDRVQRGSAPEQAAQEAIAYLYKRLQGHGGIILLGPDGRFGLAHNTPRMAWGLANADGLRTGLSSEELT
jgi:beta-aspartyl-peptidase (threonine type)